MPSARGLFRRAVAQSVPGTYFSAELARDIAVEIGKEAGLAPDGRRAVRRRPAPTPGGGRAVERKDARVRRPVGPGGAHGHALLAGRRRRGAAVHALGGAGGGRGPRRGTARRAQPRRVPALPRPRRPARQDHRGAGGVGAADVRAGPGRRTRLPRGLPRRHARANSTNAYRRTGCSTCRPCGWPRRRPRAAAAPTSTNSTWPAPGFGGALGACHGLDIPLLFGTYDADLGKLLFAGSGVPAEAKALTARFQSAWTAFARTGDPGWPAYDGEGRLTQVLDAEPEVRPYPEEVSRRLWEGYDFPALPLLK